MADMDIMALIGVNINEEFSPPEPPVPFGHVSIETRGSGDLR